MKKKPRSRKKKESIVGRAAIFAVAAAIIAVAVYAALESNAEKAKTAATGANIYFFDAQTYSLKPEVRPNPASEKKEMVRFVLEELSIGPKTVSLQPSVPDGLIKSAEIMGTNVNVELSTDYYGLSNSDEIISRAAIVYTLADLPFIETVMFNVAGNELFKQNEQPFGNMKASDIVMTPDINPQGESRRTLTLYFADPTGTGLVPETRTIFVNPNESVAKYIVQELITGPSTEGLLPTVPPETKPLVISVSDGVCTVDLSKEFISKHTGPPGFERLTIYSIVNSLSELSDIKSVLFLIEGRRVEQFKDETGFNNLYEAMDILPAGTEPPPEETEESYEGEQ